MRKVRSKIAELMLSDEACSSNQRGSEDAGTDVVEEESPSELVFVSYGNRQRVRCNDVAWFPLRFCPVMAVLKAK
jgi:hypothetical protein